MASVYRDKETDKKQGAGTDLAKAVGGKIGAGSVQSGSDGYAARINALAQDGGTWYEPNESVTKAKEYLQNVSANRPGSYQNKYTGQIADIYNRIMNRERFSYDMNADAMYDQYARMYREAGLRGMRDAMGMSAAATGGFGNSYAQTAGSEAYAGAMRALAEKVPELRDQALQRYNDETDRLTRRYETARAAEDSAYARYADDYDRWADERNYAAEAYDRERDFDADTRGDALARAEQIVRMEREDEAEAKSLAQKQLSAFLSAGVMPDRELIAKAGWTAADVRKLLKGR